MVDPVPRPSLVGALVCLGLLLLWSPGCRAARQSSAVNRTSEFTFRDCSDLPADSPSGVYTLRPGMVPLNVKAFCDMDHDQGGWTVVLRRKDIEPREDFLRDWGAYKWGIGHLEQEFYWGNQYLWMLTSQLDRRYQVHFWLEDFEGNTAYALYQNFVVESESEYYKLLVGEYSGNAGDELYYNSNHSFTTYDEDHDSWSSDNCASFRGGGWWYGSCTFCKLTGEYFDGGISGNAENGIVWRSFKGSEPYSMKTAIMKIKPSLKS